MFQVTHPLSNDPSHQSQHLRRDPLQALIRFNMNDANSAMLRSVAVLNKATNDDHSYQIDARIQEQIRGIVELAASLKIILSRSQLKSNA
jgi:hypothetical protein